MRSMHHWLSFADAEDVEHSSMDRQLAMDQYLLPGTILSTFDPA